MPMPPIKPTPATPEAPIGAATSADPEYPPLEVEAGDAIGRGFLLR